ncbi:MAG: nuclear transport factor 2 family protein [Verrucomicrobia bacterium]|nr:nuclear transport factor 2 family protein [Verrucomicrobiota bacterium]
MNECRRQQSSNPGSLPGFVHGDIQPLISILDENVEWSNYEDNPLNGTVHGPEAVTEFMESLGQMEFNRFKVVSVMSDGDKVIGVIDATYTVKSTGKSHSGIAAHLFEFQDGKMVRFREVAATSADAWE